MRRANRQVLDRQRRQPTRYLANAAAQPIKRLRVGPSCQDTRHHGRSHPTATVTCASSDSTIGTPSSISSAATVVSADRACCSSSRRAASGDRPRAISTPSAR